MSIDAFLAEKALNHIKYLTELNKNGLQSLQALAPPVGVKQSGKLLKQSVIGGRVQFINGVDGLSLHQRKTLEQNTFIHNSDRFLITNKLSIYQYFSFLKMLSKSPFRSFLGYSSVDPCMPNFPFRLRL